MIPIRDVLESRQAKDPVIDVSLGSKVRDLLKGPEEDEWTPSCPLKSSRILLMKMQSVKIIPYFKASTGKCYAKGRRQMSENV